MMLSMALKYSGKNQYVLYQKWNLYIFLEYIEIHWNLCFSLVYKSVSSYVNFGDGGAVFNAVHHSSCPQ